MEKFFTLLISLLEKLTLGKVLQFGLLVLFLILGYVGYSYTPLVAQSYVMHSHDKHLEVITVHDDKLINAFMGRYRNKIPYLSILKFDFPKNLRIPIHRSFNDEEVKRSIMSRLDSSNNGNLPIFIDNDQVNNDQIITLMKGEMLCSPFKDGGVAKLWPDLQKKIVTSCRMPIPPVFGIGVTGYVVIHMAAGIKPYEMEGIEIELRVLAKTIHANIK